MTFNARDSFRKSSNVFNQPPDFSSGGVVSGGAQGPNFSVVAPVAEQLSNAGSVGISYQFALNDMVGASGTFSNLHYPNPSQVQGLYDSSSQGGLAFYSRRVARGQYIGVTYAYQRLLAYPTIGQNETQTHAALLFYTLLQPPRSSRSRSSADHNTRTPFSLLLSHPFDLGRRPVAPAWAGKESGIALPSATRTLSRVVLDWLVRFSWTV